MLRDNPLVTGLGCLVWMAFFAFVLAIASLIAWALWSWIGVGMLGFRTFTFWEVAGFIYIVGVLAATLISWKDLLRILRNSWRPMWYHPLEAVLLRLLQLVLVFAALATLAFAFTIAWNWVVVRLHLVTFQGVLIAFLVIALPYLLFLEWLDLGDRLWRRFRFL